MALLKEQMADPLPLVSFTARGGVDASVEDDGSGWVWLAADVSPGGLRAEFFKAVPYGKAAILVAKQSNVDELFCKAAQLCFLRSSGPSSTLVACS
ncbi:unnamed protein product [Effrenium voratum]|nr:unnamed protein product [Effrenium voratum]CAJ1460186.1 unnamed protein product [Effrenium voratum]